MIIQQEAATPPNGYLRLALLAAAALLVTACATAIIVHAALPERGVAIR